MAILSYFSVSTWSWARGCTDRECGPGRTRYSRSRPGWGSQTAGGRTDHHHHHLHGQGRGERYQLDQFLTRSEVTGGIHCLVQHLGLTENSITVEKIINVLVLKIWNSSGNVLLISQLETRKSTRTWDISLKILFVVFTLLLPYQNISIHVLEFFLLNNGNSPPKFKSYLIFS